MSDIVEAAFNSLWSNTRLADVVLSPTLLHALAEKVTAAVTSPILERAAKVAEDYDAVTPWEFSSHNDAIAAAIRALKKQP